MGDVRIARHLGRVLDAGGAGVGTCFQVAPCIVVTAWHVVADLDRGHVGAWVDTDALDGSAGPCPTRVVAVDPVRDLAVLRRSETLPGAVPRLMPTDAVDLLTDVVITGVSAVDDHDHEYRYLDATGVWQGGTVRDGRVPLGRLTSTAVMRGMSGAPVLRLADSAVVGVVSARYNSADGWLRNSVWVARIEDLAGLLESVGEITLSHRLVLASGEVGSMLSVRAAGGDTAAAHIPDYAPKPATVRDCGGPYEAALEVARVLAALDNAARGAATLGPVLDHLITNAFGGDPGGRPAREFRARLRARGLDPRLLVRSTTEHEEAVRRWAGPLGGQSDAAEETSAVELLTSFRRVVAGEVSGELFAELAESSRRYLAEALTDGHTMPLSAFLHALTAQLPPLRSTSTEAVLARPPGDDGAGTRSGGTAASSASESASSVSASGGTAPHYHRAQLASLAAQMIRLPDPDPYVVGRNDLVATIVRKIDQRMSRQRSATAFLSGQPGVGTSVVAIEAARLLSPAFSGGVYYVDLSGLVPEARRHARDVVRKVGEALGLELGGGAREDAYLFEAFAAQLRERNILLVLDNALDAEHVAPLVKTPTTCAIIVTSRDSVQSYADPGLVFRVDPLDRRASVEVLAACDEDRAREAEDPGRAILHRIAHLCADVPMALRMFGARMASRPDLSLDHLLQLLEQETTRLDYLDAGDRAVRVAIKLSYDILDTDVAHTFRLVAAAPGFALTGSEAGYCLDTPEYDQEKLLNRLVDRSLAKQQAVRAFSGRLLATFTLFDLVLLFAKERLSEEEPEELVRDFQHRSVAFLRDRLTEINDQRGDADLSGELDPTRFHAAVQLAEGKGWLDLATELALGLHVLYSARGELDAIIAVNDTRVDLHLRHGQPEEAVKACLLNADTLAKTAPEAALESARRAVRIAREHALTAQAAEADFKLSLLLWNQKDLAGSLEASERSADVLIALGRQAQAVPVATNTCSLARELGDTGRALRWGRTATELGERWGDADTRASAFFERGRAELRADRAFDAIASNRRAEELYKSIESWWNAGVSCQNAAWAASTVDDLATAVEMLSRAADHWERRGSVPHLLETLVDLSALHMQVDAFAQAGHVLARALRAAGAESDLQDSPLLRTEVLLRNAAMRMFVPDAGPEPEVRLPTLPAGDAKDDGNGNGNTQDDPELQRVRDVLEQHHRGALPDGRARELVRGFLADRTRNGPPPLPQWLHDEFGKERPGRTALGSG
ncbi:trypsin-like peptidase domain-containing protein [Streptomyces sp. NPDC101151]|uniref:trypsin-like peptidase domain-containing protein n=1 Tax=Streptomyces sp. NPDC101151 TaxID=3366115 RepID=UPI00381FEBDC